ncbi:MAG: glycosyltransferase family 4 protein [Balneolaceae bacterium]|nr:glycosyltransferase family 4 protein [Balneolaceae bacterium]
MRILIATNGYPTEKNPTRQVFVKNIADGLQKAGVDIEIVFNPYFRFFKDDLETGGPFSAFFKTLFFAAACLPYLLYKAKRFDLIYSHSAIWPGFMMLAAARLHRIKHVCYAHGSINEYLQKKGLLYKLAKFTMKQCNAIFTNSHFMQQQLSTNYDCSSVIVSPGYKSDVFYFKPKEKLFDLFFAGNAIERKGADLILNAVHNHLHFYKENSIRVQINCSGVKKDDYIRFVKQNHLGDIITIGDRLTEDSLSDHFRSSKIVIFPSRREPLGLVGIEAIACGAFLIASNTGGIKEYVIHEENGFLFEPDNESQLQTAIETALEQHSEFQKKQPAISKTVQTYALDSSIQKTVQIFREMIRS